jgi:uncharacterized protein
MREDVLKTKLRELNDTSADIEASAVISTDGLMIASMLPDELEPDRVGAMSAAILMLGDRTARELGRGHLEQVLITGEDGYVLLAHAGKQAVVTVMATAEAKLGLIFLDVKRAAADIAKVI